MKSFPTLSQPDLVWLTAKLTRERYAPGAVILHQDEPAKRFYVVTRGKVQVFVKSASGKEFAMATIEQGGYFGETGLLRNGNSIATVKAYTDAEAEVVSIDAGTFKELLARSEAARQEIEKTASERAMRKTATCKRDACRI